MKSLSKLVLACALCAACGPGADADEASLTDTEFPGEHWPHADPEEHGFDAALLDAVGQYASSIGSSCVVVIRDGKLVYEWYDEPGGEAALHDSWSVAKSFTSSVVGAAIADGSIQSAEQHAADFIPTWRGDDRNGITIAHLLSGTSGLVTGKYPEEVSWFSYLWGLTKDYGWSIVTHDQTASALESKLTISPGTKWKYNNRAIQALDALLVQATGEDTEDYAWRRVWEPIGMSAETHWKRDPDGHPTVYSSVMVSCRDLARFGYLVLKGGRWDGEQLLDAQYMSDMTAPSQLENPAYGYLWWLNGQGPYRGNNNKRYAGTMFDFMPSDLVSAQGVGQNFVDIVPSTNTVYVHLRPAPHETFRLDVWNAVIELLDDADLSQHRELLRRFERADIR